MRELVLRRFFEGQCSATELARDISGSSKVIGPGHSVISIEDMHEEFTVTADMAVRLCDAVLSGGLPATFLQSAGFAMMASDRFRWDADGDEVLAAVIADWSCPEVNYPLTLENVRRFRSWLSRDEPYPPKPSVHNSEGKIISVTEKKAVRPLWKRCFFPLAGAWHKFLDS